MITIVNCTVNSAISTSAVNSGLVHSTSEGPHELVDRTSCVQTLSHRGPGPAGEREPVLCPKPYALIQTCQVIKKTEKIRKWHKNARRVSQRPVVERRKTGHFPRATTSPGAGPLLGAI